MLRAYRYVRDWVDGRWRAPGLQWKVLLLPAILPLLAAGLLEAGRSFLPIGFAWFGIWNAFVIWRYWFYLKEVSREADEKYDREGKYRLSSEYHDTESASAAADRKKKLKK